LGEDGPTHQPIEHLAALRATPNVNVFRPADANETSICWKCAIEEKHGPSLLVLTRQSLPTLDREKYSDVSGAEKGAYILKKEQGETPDFIFMSTGSEVHLALQAAEQLEEEGNSVRVVSMPCIELFKKQTEEYKKEVLPPHVKKRISIEAATTLGWHRWVGSDGIAIGLDRFGTSAPYEEAYEDLGITVDRIIEEANGLLG
ncbi:MAG: transketolase C-terminal domain-containing protein, partial [Balneolaceae bacterium]|nr:transketolase C-terminal domain-containing protein [Balneolaceae bacterium]